MSTPVWHRRHDGRVDGIPVAPPGTSPNGDVPGTDPGDLEATKPHRQRAIVRSQTAELLSSLGDSVDAVVTRLRSAGVRGTPTNAEQCAVAVYLRAVMTSDNRVRSVSVGNTSVMIAPEQRWRRSVAVPLPPPVRQFIEAFDERRFPELVV
ncbi:MAG TPA: hypothetical protein VEJ87_09930 [Acidimicrobiales bacterium]|nr:hypothetical protein [Acidimicrobiales bacterium]